jgi:hypothetical protein
MECIQKYVENLLENPLGRLSIWRDNIKIDPRETGCEDQRSMELVENRV